MNDLPERALAAVEKYGGWEGVLAALKDAERYRWVETNCTVDFADARGDGWFTSPVDPDLIPLSDQVDDAILNGRGDSPYMTSALRREAADEITRLRNALAQSVKTGDEHREGRLKALEWMAALESRLREIGDLAASCRTGPALREAMAQIETMTDMRPNG